MGLRSDRPLESIDGVFAQSPDYKLDTIFETFDLLCDQLQIMVFHRFNHLCVLPVKMILNLLDLKPEENI